jgi:UDP-N-acetyl-D-mannosaminuronic acid transferase (WecB/TagA/CpsF family)
VCPLSVWYRIEAEKELFEVLEAISQNQIIIVAIRNPNQENWQKSILHSEHDHWQKPTLKVGKFSEESQRVKTWLFPG